MIVGIGSTYDKEEGFMELTRYRVQASERVPLLVSTPKTPKAPSNYHKMPLEELRVRLNEEFDARPYGPCFKEMQGVYSRRLTSRR